MGLGDFRHTEEHRLPVLHNWKLQLRFSRERPKVRILSSQELVDISGDRQLPLEICPSCSAELTRPQECLGGLCKGEQGDVRNRLFRIGYCCYLAFLLLRGTHFCKFQGVGFISCQEYLFKLRQINSGNCRLSWVTDRWQFDWPPRKTQVTQLQFLSKHAVNKSVLISVHSV